MKFIIKQLSVKGGVDTHRLERVSALLPYDFCKSKKWGTTDGWLENKRGNGYSYEESVGYYNKFKLELIK